MLLSDSEGALRPAIGQASLQRLKHALRRAAILRQRMEDGEVCFGYVPDAANAVDVFTKWGEG